MNKKIAIVICLSSIFLSACGKSAQEKVAEEQLKQIEAQKKAMASAQEAGEKFRNMDVGNKNVMGDGNEPRPVRGNKNSLTDK